jgi:hypothetical protein
VSAAETAEEESGGIFLHLDSSVQQERYRIVERDGIDDDHGIPGEELGAGSDLESRLGKRVQSGSK